MSGRQLKAALPCLSASQLYPWKLQSFKKIEEAGKVGVNERKGKKKEKGEEGEGEKKKEVPSGEVIKEGASWLAWQQFKGGGSPCLPAPKWQLLAPSLNTQCLVAKLCLSLTDEWGKERKEGGGNTKCCYSLSFFFEVGKKRLNLKEVLAP